MLFSEPLSSLIVKPAKVLQENQTKNVKFFDLQNHVILQGPMVLKIRLLLIVSSLIVEPKRLAVNQTKILNFFPPRVEWL